MIIPDPRLEEIKRIRKLLYAAWNFHMVPYGYNINDSVPIYNKLSNVYGGLARMGHELEGGRYFNFNK